MAGIVVKPIIDKAEWENFMISHPEGNFLHSWCWGEFHEALGKPVQRTGFYNNEKLLGAVLSAIEDAKRGKYLTVAGGPIIEWDDKRLVKTFFDEIKKIAILNDCVFIRIRPQLISDNFSKNIFKENGFINAPMHLHAELTSQLDITKSEEELLKNMRKTTRYEIKKAQSLKIEIKENTDPKEIRQFYQLQIQTSKRQRFVPFSYKYLYEQFKEFAENNMVILYKAKIKNKTLAEAFIIFYGKEAVYHYGASTDDGKKYPGAYLIQWRAIQEAKKRGMTRYNFWGVSPIDKPKHRFHGLSLFKRGFGGEDVEYLHAQDYVINYPRYALNFFVETVRKIRRNV
ncbi:MAG: peptidoglycan bridge formation glycyltransferase FemA/FemB family protein [Candidatus Levybacteria bacterium]|nr:peptidoglycan bridge formation glycyltransferase FemA/FemB family protein [Candidatus Levybacteria bacterium]